jgi:hypothetical protein
MYRMPTKEQPISKSSSHKLGQRESLTSTMLLVMGCTSVGSRFIQRRPLTNKAM